MFVSMWMTRELITVDPAASLAHIAATMVEHRTPEGDQFLFVLRLAMLPKKVAKCPYVFFHHQVGEITTVARKDFGFRSYGIHAFFVRITQKKFARLESWARARHWLLSRNFDRRLRETITITEVFMCIVERWDRFQV